ncbi:MAG: hypothetical protein K9N35_00465 [Candidatus Marinimicrobia bacterium]|nr:hypothetical protein [Candidatus Neomarinimicrobiota bacterium]
MKNVGIAILLLQVLTACSIVNIFTGHEHIAGVTIMSVEDIQNDSGDMTREIRGVISDSFESNDEWILAIRTIHEQKKLAGSKMLILVFLEDEPWEDGVAYARGRFENNKLISLKVDGIQLVMNKP